ncbi:MAG: EAL domain-containing protein [Nitrospirota bacterium]|nr:EAL domain-containing protein [Nitrospirota bacterium]
MGSQLTARRGRSVISDKHASTTAAPSTPAGTPTGSKGFRRKGKGKPTPPPSNGNAPKGNAVRVLVVDDDRAMRELAVRSLELSGFAVASAGNGQQGALVFAEFVPDIVLLDVMMPGWDGFATCKAMRGLPEGGNTPIVMVTALDDLSSIERAYEAGATDFATKPIQWPVLAQRLRYMARQKQVADKLRESEKRLAKAQRIARLGSWEWDIAPDRLTLTSDPNSAPLDCGETFDGTFLGFVRLLHPDDAGRTLDAIHAGIRSRSPFSVEYRLNTADGAELFIHQEAEPEFDEQGNLVRLSGTIQDITTQRETEDRIQFLTRYDGLTSLPNRHMLTEQIARTIQGAQRGRHMAAILTIGLDRFERINHAFGHDVGDELLREASLRLRESVERFAGRSRSGQPPMVARLGGDEFCVVFTHIEEASEVARTAQMVLDELTDPFQVDDHEVYITSSIGAALYPVDGTSVDGLLKNAAAALKDAKVQGKNNYRFYTSTMNSDAMRRVALEGKLQKAMDNDELVLYYQPKIDIRTGRMIAMEALIRWQHPELGMVSPAEFIPLAEETGLIVNIGEWVLSEACRQNVAWQKQGLHPVQVSVNLSARQFWQDDLAERLGGLLAESGMDPRWLELEITESTFMHNAEETERTLRDLKALNISLSVDDFGTGYSSLAYLQRFPIDALKVDRSFITDVTTSADSATITRTIISMGHSLGMTVIAEGVETADQLRFVRDQGCDQIQGYLVSPPIPAESFSELLKDGNKPHIDLSLLSDSPSE